MRCSGNMLLRCPSGRDRFFVDFAFIYVVILLFFVLILLSFRRYLLCGHRISRFCIGLSLIL
jgi:hypothetical protein